MPEPTDIYISDFPDAESITNADKVTGLQGGANKNFSFNSILAWLVNAVKSAFVPIGRTINGKSLSSDITLTASDVGARPDTWTPTAEGIGAVPATEKGEPLGVPELDSSGKVPASQLPPTASTAADVSYDNTVSGLIAEDVQDALDEVADKIDGKQSTITASGILKGDGAGGVTAATPGTDYGTYSKPSGGIPSSDMASAVQTSLGKADSAYQKPSGGIPSSDMASGVQTSLGKADTAYQKPSGGIPASDLASGVIPAVPSAYTSNPEMDGTASPGSSGAWAKGDHVHPSDTTKANQSQLATEESGSTASRAYDVGEYFCWNGLFYRVIQPISNGGTFTPGTNCVTDTVGERLGLIKTVLCATGTSSNPVNTVIPLKNSHTYLVTIQRVGDQYSSFGLVVQSNGTVWKNDLASGGAYSNRYSVSTSTRTLTITAYLSAVIASIIDFGAYA